ncbi:MAG: mechanosensitive ion channel family protein [Desulfobacteraceae bacterium]|nr:mechanosensitive ion channel family protein [Desulfobacteraceae bacterium]
MFFEIAYSISTMHLNNDLIRIGRKMQDWFDTVLTSKLFSTAVLIACVLIIRTYIVHLIRTKWDLKPTIRRQWIVRVRNVTFFLVFGVAAVVWLEQLRTIAASIVVIAAALVIATKEFLLNIVGFFYRTTAKFVTIGDRIEVDGTRGDVIDQNLMGITLLEIGPGDKTHQYTGLTIYLPNSLFLSARVKNEIYLWSDYVFHLITIPVKSGETWYSAEKALFQAASEACAPFIEEARGAMTSQALQHSLEEPNIEPRVQIQVVDPEKYNLVVRLPVPSRKRGRLEQDITRRYLQLLGESSEQEGVKDPSRNNKRNVEERG